MIPLAGVTVPVPPSPVAVRRTFYLSAAKPAIDGLGALLLLVALLPLLLVLAAWIRLDSPGPALFRQVRMGLGGRPFRIYKFRTMRTDQVGPLLTQHGDSRITRVGHLLRRTSLDELPQCLNVLRGEMSFIGPRPEVPGIVEEEWTQETWGVLAVRPGLSGWAQIHGRDDLSIPEKAAYDLEYVARASFWFDLRIFLATPGVLLGGKGIK